MTAHADHSKHPKHHAPIKATPQTAKVTVQPEAKPTAKVDTKNIGAATEVVKAPDVAWTPPAVKPQAPGKPGDPR